MDWGVITAVVAAIFAALGIGIGLFMSKFFSGKEEKNQVSAVEERIEGIADRISETAKRVNEKLETLREESLAELKREIASLEEDVKRLKREVATLPLSAGSLEAIEKAEKLLREIEFTLPAVDSSLLTQIKDNLIILRNDVQSLLQLEKEKEEKASQIPDLEGVLFSVNSALELSRKINAALVKSELLTLAASIKGDLKGDVVKELDDQALNSKELVLLLEGVKKELEGVAK